MTNHEWLKGMTQEQLAALLTSGNVAKLNKRAREVWMGCRHTKEDEVFALDRKPKEKK